MYSSLYSKFPDDKDDENLSTDELRKFITEAIWVEVHKVPRTRPEHEPYSIKSWTFLKQEAKEMLNVLMTKPTLEKLSRWWVHVAKAPLTYRHGANPPFYMLR